MDVRKPKGYVGKNHETLGADIVAVLRILKLPEHVLGAEEAKRLAGVDPNGWYPIAWMLELMEKIEQEVGPYGLLRLGRTILKESLGPEARARLRSARDFVEVLDDLYHRTNRGTDIGGWRVLEFAPGSARLEKTTLHHCMMEQGILAEAFALVGCPVSLEQSQCLRRGANACVYEVTSSITDTRWTGGR